VLKTPIFDIFTPRYRCFTNLCLTHTRCSTQTQIIKKTPDHPTIHLTEHSPPLVLTLTPGKNEASLESLDESLRPAARGADSFQLPWGPRVACASQFYTFLRKTVRCLNHLIGHPLPPVPTTVLGFSCSPPLCLLRADSLQAESTCTRSGWTWVIGQPGIRDVKASCSFEQFRCQIHSLISYEGSNFRPLKSQAARSPTSIPEYGTATLERRGGVKARKKGKFAILYIRNT